MIIFLRNIPPETKKYEIASIIDRVFNGCFVDEPSAKISLEDIEILSIEDVDSNTFETHGLVKIFPKEIGKSVLKRLEGMIFKEKRITVHEYVIRTASNDPRNKHQVTIIDFKEQRASDRRRGVQKNINVNRR